MAKGSKYWAKSYVFLKNGQKLYLKETIDDIKAKIYSEQRFIDLNISGLYGRKITINKHFIYYYSKV